MADKAAKTRKQVGGAAARAKEQTEGAVSQSKEAVERKAWGVGVRGVLREVPYAGLGLGRVVADAVRDVETTSLLERVRRTPGSVVSKVSKQGPNLQVRYLALAARGRGERLKTAGQQAAGGAAKQTKAAAKRTEAAASRTEAAASRTEAARSKTKGDGA
jgi:hypothetical protein